ncbi:hypothetical protein V6N12_024469 [Hibiscus sabdariffa]|uniref:Uncharacterized protein n=1 Tax=Hibiscus sabdariffa TaxID=183260 RepID=A0ABR2G1L7_9ROSI
MADETLDQSISSSLAKTLPPAVSLTQDNTFQDEAAHDRFFRAQVPKNDNDENLPTKMGILSAKISCLKGLAAEAITPGVTNSIAFNILVAYFRPYFNYVNRRDKAMCTLFHELMLASSITFQEFPAEFLIDLTPPCTYTSRRCEPEENVDYRPTQLPPPQTRREEREL